MPHGVLDVEQGPFGVLMQFDQLARLTFKSEPGAVVTGSVRRAPLPIKRIFYWNELTRSLRQASTAETPRRRDAETQRRKGKDKRSKRQLNELSCLLPKAFFASLRLGALAVKSPGLGGFMKLQAVAYA